MQRRRQATYLRSRPDSRGRDKVSLSAARRTRASSALHVSKRVITPAADALQAEAVVAIQQPETPRRWLLLLENGL